MKLHLFLFVVVGMVCFGEGWRVFPLPDQPVQSLSRPSAPSYTAPRVPLAASRAPASKPYVAPSVASVPSRNDVKPGSGLSLSNVKEPAKDLLPPKEGPPA